MPITHPTYHRPRGRRRSWRPGLGTACALAFGALAVFGAPPSTATTLVVTGAGEGHGVGMSQDGALGLARHGFSYQQILAHYYTGTTIGVAPPKSVIKVLVGSKVVKVPLERYVRGVVSAEMPAEWPAAALEAQAVASRTYALTSDAGGSRFDVYSDTRSQVYEGVAAETSATNAAVAATAAQIVLYAGHPAITYFFASSGGMTENIEDSFLGSEPAPWLRGVADPYESKATSSWRVSLGFTAVAARLHGLLKGAFRGIEVLRRGVSPRIVSALILGSGGSTPISGPELAGLLGLRSTWAFFSVRNGSRVRPEPDRSGHTAPSSPSPPPIVPAAPPAGRQGGAQAPPSGPSGRRSGASTAATGGAAAG